MRRGGFRSENQAPARAPERTMSHSRICEICLRPLVRRKGECSRDWSRRRTCSRSCASKCRHVYAAGPGATPTGVLSYSQIGQLLGMSREGVRKIEHRALRKLRLAIEKDSHIE